ncbi:MAG: phospho-N-acetylmuramoyl-pentapeptide-transferase [Erysipelotrichaceae bacterium]|jgi:phospho-N-acetylmuramoyl-pentapeptide-transferase|nr:phospho-N-acetylmuramoyl-pentapeptide-transferase [Erysipelotrichaceae bacterium]
MTLRLGAVFIVSLVATLIVIPPFIRYLQRIQLFQVVSQYSLKEYQEKAKTPIMGGLAFVIIPLLVMIVFFWQEVFTPKLVVILLSFLCYGFVGFLDDFRIVAQHDNKGLSVRQKLFLQLILAIAMYLIYRETMNSDLYVPLLNINLYLGAGYAFLMFFMFVGASNAVNITDGMDGLAGGTTVLALVPFIFLALRAGDEPVAGFALALAGSLLGYLRYNLKPARIFMGDTGSLALGAALAALAIVLKQELLLAVIGFVFVYETFCVILQQIWVRVFHKRIFAYTPIHYAFKLRGYREEAIVGGFWLLGLVCAIIGLILA